VTETKLAFRAYMTEPERSVYVLTFCTTDGDFQRIRITRAHLGNIIADGACALLRTSLLDAEPARVQGPSRLHGAFIKEDGDAA
jgi:hypothetical protein